MSQFETILDLFKDMGESITEMANTGPIMYAIYLIAFLAIIYKLIEVGINRGKFEGKPARVISIMLSIMITGGVFYGKETQELLDLFSNIGGFIIILALSLGITLYSISLYKNHKRRHPSAALFSISLGLYVATSLLLPQMEFLIEKVESFEILSSILGLVNIITLLAVIITGFKLFFSIFSSPASKASNRATKEFKETATLKQYTNNLKTQLNQGGEIVNNLRRLI